MAAFSSLTFLVSTIYVLLTTLCAPGICVETADLLPSFRLPQTLPSDFAIEYPDAVVNVTDPEATGGRTIAIPLPPKVSSSSDQLSAQMLSTEALSDERQQLADSHREFLKTSLPALLSQFGVPDDQINAKVNEGIPLLMDFYNDMTRGDQDPTTQADQAPTTQGGQDLATRSMLVERGLLSLFGDIGCSIAAAAVGVPLILSARTAFAILNIGRGTSVTDDQNFYINPVHGDIATSAPVKIYYAAHRPPFFYAYATTFNKDVYVQPKSDHDPTFENVVRLLLHEIEHVQQYRDFGYSVTLFAYKYAFQICKYKYNNAPLENDARAKENAAYDLLDDPVGQWFHRIWSDRSLKSTLGFPTQVRRKTVRVQPCGEALELPFQQGVLQIRLGDGYRVYNSWELNNHDPTRPFQPYQFNLPPPPACPTSTTSSVRATPTRRPIGCSVGCNLRICPRFCMPESIEN